MASPVKDAKAQAQTRWPGAAVVERGKGHIRHQHPTDPTKFVVQTQVGRVGWHFGDGPFTEANEVDTAWVDADPADTPWQKKMVLADYNAYAFREATLGFDQGQLIEYVHPASGETVAFQPRQLQWTNDIDQIDPIADPAAVSAAVNDAELKWTDAYGPGIDFRWVTGTGQLQKYVDIANLAAIADIITDPGPPENPDLLFGQRAPPRFIRDGGNPVLKIGFIFQRSAGVRLWVDGEEWNEKANNPQSTFNHVEFRLDATGEILWWLKAPLAWDDAGIDVQPSLHLRKSGPNLLVEVRTSWAWLQTAKYPIVIDATLDVQTDASADDSMERDDTTATNIAATGVILKGDQSGGGFNNIMGAILTLAGIASGDTVDVAYASLFSYAADPNDNADLDLDFEAVDDAVIFDGSNADLSGRTLTGNSVQWDDASLTNAAFNDTSSLVTPLQAVINRGGWAAGQDVCLILDTDGASSARCQFRTWDTSGNVSGPKLYVEYTAAGAPAAEGPLVGGKLVGDGILVGGRLTG